MVIRQVTVPAGTTVGLFAATSTAVAASFVTVSTPNYNSLQFVESSGGTLGFPIVSQQIISTKEEIWVRNPTTADATLLVRILAQ